MRFLPLCFLFLIVGLKGYCDLTPSAALPEPQACYEKLADLVDILQATPFRIDRLQSLKREGRYYVITMSDQYTGENRTPHNEDGELVTYFDTAQAREMYRIVIKDHLLYHADEKTLYDTGNGLDLFVMDGDGNIYASPPQNGFAHSTYLAGAPAAAAGKIKVSKGVLTYVDNNSGHYLPPIEMIYQFLHHLLDLKVDTSKVRIFEKRR